MAPSRIFVVEDDNELRSLYLNLLKSVGSAKGFANAAEFLTHLKDHPDEPPDLVVTDYSMPSMSGVRMIAEAAKLGAKFPVILVSGLVDKNTAIEAVNTGFCMILEKPVKSAEMRETVRHLLLIREMEKTRSQMLSVIEEMQELHAAFRHFCIEELELNSVLDPEAVLDAGGEGHSTSVNQALESIEKKLIQLKNREAEISKKVREATERVSVNRSA